MVKIKSPFEALQEKFANHPHFLKNLLSEDYNTEGNPLSLIKFESQLKQAKIVYYPSSGSDITDLILLNSKRLNELSDLQPTMFFHSDYLNLNTTNLENNLLEKSFIIVDKFSYQCLDTYQSINIYKLKSLVEIEKVKFIWLVSFCGYYNEDIVDFCITSKLKTKIVYSYCNAITNDKMNCNPYPIPTIFFPFMVEELGIESIITEQDAKYITEVIAKGNSRDIKNWLNKVNAVAPNGLISALLEIKDPTELKNKIIEALTRFEEHPIDEIEHPKLVIKKI